MQPAEREVLEQPLGVRLRRAELARERRQPGADERDRQLLLRELVEGHAERAHRHRLEVLHLVDEVDDALAAGARGLADLDEQLGQVVLDVAAVGAAGDRRRRRCELEAARRGHVERLQHAERPLHAVLDRLLAAEAAQQPVRHAADRGAEVGRRADLDHAGAVPAALDRELLELEQQHGLADAAQARVDEAAALLARLEPREQRVEALHVVVAAGEERRHRPGAGAVGVGRPRELHDQRSLAVAVGRCGEFPHIRCHDSPDAEPTAPTDCSASG